LTNEFGEVVAWEQEVRGDMGTNTERFEPGEIATISITKASGRDNIGISQALRAEEEIESYMQNSRAINNAVEIAAYPHHFWKVGNEGANVIDDDELRRFRNMVDDMEGDTQFVAGADVEHELIEASNFEFEKITEHDLRKLALALGVPLELANVGSDGLGSGMPAELRKTLFERQGRADQRKLTGEVTEQLLRPIIEEYSPFDASEYDGMRLGDPIGDREDSSLTELAPWLTTNEIREQLDREPEEDEEIGDSYRKPANIEAPEQEEPEDGDGLGGLFGSDSRELDIQERFIEETELTEEDFVPNSDVEDVVREASEFVDANGLPNPENQREGAARMNQLLDHAENNEPLEFEFWEEIANFHSRHRAQDNHECDESSVDAEDIEGDFDACYLDPGWFSDKTWGGDPGFEQAERIVEAVEESDIDLSGGRDFRHLSGTPQWDEHFLELYERIWNEGAELSEFFSSETPEFVKQRLKDAIWSGSVFHDIESIPSDQLMQLREFLTEELEDGNWNIDGIANRLQDLEGDLSQERAELIARTETASTVNTAREIGYEERGQEDGLFYWTGALDDRTTEACRWLINQTNPNHGGDPVPLEELRDLIEEAPTHDPEMQDDLARPEDYVVHPAERKTWVRHVE
jgi:hypothetical protein